MKSIGMHKGWSPEKIILRGPARWHHPTQGMIRSRRTYIRCRKSRLYCPAGGVGHPAGMRRRQIAGNLRVPSYLGGSISVRWLTGKFPSFGGTRQLGLVDPTRLGDRNYRNRAAGNKENDTTRRPSPIV